MIDSLPYIDKYKIVKELPSGGWARIFLARYRYKYVVLKMLFEKYSYDKKKVEEFFSEAKTLSNFDHPNIARVIDTGPNDSPPYYFSMEYYSGGNLYSYIKEKKILPKKELLYLAHEICKALQEIHKSGFIHLDLKPSNILFGENQKIVISDFGISKCISDTAERGIRGTPQYMSPEQFDGIPAVTSDLYSLGIILYYASSGQLPFDSEDLTQIGLLHNKVPPLPVRDFNPLIDKKLEQIILKLLEKKPANRYQSAQEVISELNKVPLSEDSQKKILVIETKDSSGKVRPREFERFPVTISKYKESSSNISVLDTFASKEHATILNPEEGKFLYTDHSKNGSVVNGKKLVDESVDIDPSGCKVTIGNTELKISFREKKSYSQYFFAAATVIAVIAVIASFFLFWPPKTNNVIISDLKGIQNIVYTDKEYSFSFTMSIPSGKIPVKIVLIPFKSGVEIAQPMEANTFTWTSEQVKNDTGEYKFSIYVQDDKGDTSNHLNKKIIIRKQVFPININVQSPGEVVVGRNFPINIDLTSKYKNEGIYINLKDDAGATQMLPYRGRNYQWHISREGSAVLTIQAGLNNGTIVSNAIIKNIHVVPAIAPPIIEYVTEPILSNGRLRFAFNITDPVIQDPSQFTIFLNMEPGHIHTRLTEYNASVQIQEPGTYQYWLTVSTSDNRRGSSERRSIEFKQ